MKKFLTVVGIILTVVIIGILGLLGYVKYALPNVGKAPDIRVESSEANIARGKYLANHVMVCIGCHSERNWEEFAGPAKEGTQGQGGELFDQRVGLPGAYYAANITPHGIKDWTDGEIFRAITTGVRKNGKAIFPIMPYEGYREGDEQDIKCVIAYLRTLQSIDKNVPESHSDFPMNFIINTIPQKADLKPRPSETDTKAYGKYLVSIGGCRSCHTPFDKGEYDNDKMFGGGRVFALPGGNVTSANISPDPETGIGNWTKEAFVNRFKAYVDSNNSPLHQKVSPTDFNTVMPWTFYSGMTAEDLGCIYEYLRSVQPIQQQITKFVPKGE
jgi:mono/diheme cytochrome c family protein